MRIAGSPELYGARYAQLLEKMIAQGIDAAIVSSGSEMLWLTGHSFDEVDSTNLLFVMPGWPRPAMLVSVLEVQNLRDKADVMDIVAGPNSTELKQRFEAGLGDHSGNLVVSDFMPVRLQFPLRQWLTGAQWNLAGNIFNPLRRIKTSSEIDALRTVAWATDQVVLALQSGAVPFRGRTERAVAKDVRRLFRETGHDTVDFVIVAFGPNAASPHHEPDNTVIGDGILLFDIGGSIGGYRSDTTRCVHVGRPLPGVGEAYDTLLSAQEAAFQIIEPGIPARDIDCAARDVIDRTSHCGHFIHGLGHGIGLDTHEAPSVSARSVDTVQVGDVFSVEPGIYYEGRWGMRVEDIVVVTEDGHERLNRTPRALFIVED